MPVMFVLLVAVMTHNGPNHTSQWGYQQASKPMTLEACQTQLQVDINEGKPETCASITRATAMLGHAVTTN